MQISIIKQFISFFLILNLLNTSLLFPEISMENVYSKKNIFSKESIFPQQEEEINSLIEFVTEHLLNIPDHSPEDEDDDIPDPFRFRKSKMLLEQCLGYFSSGISPPVFFIIIFEELNPHFLLDLVIPFPSYYFFLFRLTPF